MGINITLYMLYIIGTVLGGIVGIMAILELHRKCNEEPDTVELVTLRKTAIMTVLPALAFALVNLFNDFMTGGINLYFDSDTMINLSRRTIIFILILNWAIPFMGLIDCFKIEKELYGNIQFKFKNLVISLVEICLSGAVGWKGLTLLF